MNSIINSGWNLKHLSHEQQDNYDIVFAAVSHFGYALEFASKDKQDKCSIITAAINQDWNAYQFASDDQKNKKIHDVLKLSPFALQYIDITLFNKHISNTDIRQLLEREPHSIKYMHEIKNNDELVMKCVMIDGTTLKHASIRLRSSYQHVRAAILEDGNAIEYASLDITNEEALSKLAVEQKLEALRYVNQNIFTNDEILSFLETNLNVFHYLDASRQMQFYDYVSPGRDIHKNNFIVMDLQKIAG